MKEVFRTLVRWLVCANNAVVEGPYAHLYDPRGTVITLNIVTLAHVESFSYRYLSIFYKRLYKAYCRQLKRYDYVTAWYDALDNFYDVYEEHLEDLDLCTYDPYYIFSPKLTEDWKRIDELCRLERNYEVYTVCDYCIYRAKKERYNTHQHYCYDSRCSWCEEREDCDVCNGVYYKNCEEHSRRPVFDGVHECTCVGFRNVSDDGFIRVLNKALPVLKEYGWTFNWSNGLTIVPPYEDLTLDHAEELALQWEC